MKIDDRPMYWRLDEDHKTIPTDHNGFVEMFVAGLETHRRVAEDTVGDMWISTVFLALDYGFGDGPPVLFETMIFHAGDGREQWRYSTWDEAIAGHKAVVKALQDGTELPE